jgi:voltage-gated sodium channel
VILILVGALLIGLEAQFDDYNNPTYDAGNTVISCFFIIEIFIRLAAEEFYIFYYYSQLANVLDTLVIVVSLVPGGGVYVTVLRLARILRVFKIADIVPGLGVIVSSLIYGLSSIGYTMVVITLTYYIYAIITTTFFLNNDALHFGTLHQSMASLFDIATLDNWGDIMYTQIYGCDVYPYGNNRASFNGLDPCIAPVALGGWAALVFVSFVTIGSMVMLTLFIGVVTTSMEIAVTQHNDANVSSFLTSFCFPRC